MHRKTSLHLICISYVSFISLGLPDGLLGVAWPSIRQSFDLSLDSIGTLLIPLMGGYLLSSFTSGRTIVHLGVGRLATLSSLLVAIGLLGFALSPAWWVVVAFGIAIGLGAGAMDASMNTYAAENYTPQLVNWLHACFGLGTAFGALVMTYIVYRGWPWHWGYGLAALLQGALVICLGLMRKHWRSSRTFNRDPNNTKAVGINLRDTLKLSVVWKSMCVFCMYSGIELCAGTWIYSIFTESRSMSLGAAGLSISFYWSCLTVGRLLSGMIVRL